MEKHDDLNSSIVSSASAISAIGLESTMTKEFQELKALQSEVSNQVDRVVDYYERVKDMVVDETQNGSGQQLIDLETFDEERHAAVEILLSYYSKTAAAVRLHVDAKSRKRVKKIHRFVNMMKVKLESTKEMAADGEPEEIDEQFLAKRDASFPIGMIPAGALEFPIIESPIKGTTQERKMSSKGFSEITSTYGLRGRDFLEKFTTPAKKALADLTLTLKTNAASKEFDPVMTVTAV